MGFQRLFFSMEGRIGRGTYWIGLIGIAVVSSVAGLIGIVIGARRPLGRSAVESCHARASSPLRKAAAGRWPDLGLRTTRLRQRGRATRAR